MTLCDGLGSQRPSKQKLSIMTDGSGAHQDGPPAAPRAGAVAGALRELGHMIEQRRGNAGESELAQIVMALRQFPNEPEVVTAAARTLRLAVTASPDGSARAVDAGAAEALVTALRTLPQPTPQFARQPSVVALYGHGWRCLNSLVCGNPGRTAARVVQAGGADFALGSVPLLTPMRPVLPFAVGTLTLALQFDPTCRSSLIAKGAAQVLVSVLGSLMQSLDSVAGADAVACKAGGTPEMVLAALEVLAMECGDEGREAVVAAGALQAAVSAMRAAPRHRLLQAFALELLQSLILPNPTKESVRDIPATCRTNAEDLLACGGLEAAVAALSAHGASRGDAVSQVIAFRASLLIQRLELASGHDGSARDRAVESGAVSSVAAALFSHASDARTAAACLSCAMALVVANVCCSAADLGGASQHFLAAAHPPPPSLLRSRSTGRLPSAVTAALTPAHAVGGMARRASQVSSAGILEATARAIQANPESRNVAHVALTLLGSLLVSLVPDEDMHGPDALEAGATAPGGVTQSEFVARCFEAGIPAAVVTARERASRQDAIASAEMLIDLFAEAEAAPDGERGRLPRQQPPRRAPSSGLGGMPIPGRV